MPQLPPAYRSLIITTLVEAEPFLGTLPGFSRSKVSTALDRGDLIAVNLFQEKLVGFGYTATQTTQVTSQIEAHIPVGARYGHSAYTDPNHRNLQLAKVRWLERMRFSQASQNQLSVAYIATDNFASLAMYFQDGAQPNFHGIVGYWRWRGQEYPFNSSAARRLGFRFARSHPPR